MKYTFKLSFSPKTAGCTGEGRKWTRRDQILLRSFPKSLGTLTTSPLPFQGDWYLPPPDLDLPAVVSVFPSSSMRRVTRSWLSVLLYWSPQADPSTTHAVSSLHWELPGYAVRNRPLPVMQFLSQNEAWSAAFFEFWRPGKRRFEWWWIR